MKMLGLIFAVMIGICVAGCDDAAKDKGGKTTQGSK
jgi:hypothetical protein